jgi:hypothetical protein
MEREARVSEAARPAIEPSDPLARWSAWGFLVCALIAIGFGVGALYGSGSRALAIDVTRELEGARGGSTNVRLGPYRLEPGMNPLRFILNASHAPLGSARRRYDLALEDAKGATFWRSSGSLGSHGDAATLVMTRTSLVTFEVPRADDYFVRVRGSGASMDDLRAATLELRRDVTRVDTRIPWGFGIAAIACLLANLVAALRRPRALELVGRERERAA